MTSKMEFFASPKSPYPKFNLSRLVKAEVPLWLSQIPAKIALVRAASIGYSTPQQKPFCN